MNTTLYEFDVDLNLFAISRMNNIISNSSTFYTFGIGMYIANLQNTYTSGYAQWYDLRLVVTFEYTKEIIKTKDNLYVLSGHFLQKANTRNTDRIPLIGGDKIYHSDQSYHINELAEFLDLKQKEQERMVK